MTSALYAHTYLASLYLLMAGSQRAIGHRLGWIRNTQFLEQFRYTIVASQLLNEHSNPIVYRQQSNVVPPDESSHDCNQENNFAASVSGLLWTLLAAFTLVLATQWMSTRVLATFTVPQILLLLIGFAAVALVAYSYSRRQWLNRIRTQAIKNASKFTGEMQQFDAAASAGLTMVQEVELVSRGYQM